MLTGETMPDKFIYKIFIQFKNGKSLEFTIETDADLRKAFLSELGGTHIMIGDFILDAKEILWARIEGANAEHSEQL